MPYSTKLREERNQLVLRYRETFGKDAVSSDIFKWATLFGTTQELYDTIEHALLTGAPLTDNQIASFVCAAPAPNTR